MTVVRRLFGASILIAGIASSATALAAPVHLLCEFKQEGRVWPINFVLDEVAARAALIVPSTGLAEQSPAVFSADRVIVRFKATAYEINRVDLTVIRTSPYLKSADRGVCKVEEAPKRAF